MNEETIRMAAQLYSLIAEMEEIKANIKAMEADNIARERRGEALAWPGSMFQEASEALSNLSWRFKNEI